MVYVPVREPKTDISVQSVRQRENSPSSASCSIQALNRWGDAHPRWGGQSELSPQIQMLILSVNTLIDTARNNI